MSENWTREHMVAVYGEAGADAMRKLSAAYARIEALEAVLRSGCVHSKTMPDCESCKRRVAFACLEFLLREQINGVICAEDNDPCDRCAANWKRVRVLLDGEKS